MPYNLRADTGSILYSFAILLVETRKTSRRTGSFSQPTGAEIFKSSSFYRTPPVAAFITGLTEIFRETNSTLEQATDVHLRRAIREKNGK